MIDRNFDMLLHETYDALHAMFGDNLQDVLLYGSYARGDFDEESDVDVMALVNLTREELAKKEREVSGISSDLDLKHDVVLSIVLQDTETFLQYRNALPFFKNVMREGISIVH